jgi:hypothetical protein
MLPSIGYASTARSPLQDLSSYQTARRSNAGRDDTSSENGSFDQAFASATNDHGAQSDRSQKSNTQDSSDTVSPQASGRRPVRKQSATGQVRTKQNDAQAEDMDTNTGAPSAKPAAGVTATIASAAGERKQEKASSLDAKRQEGNEGPAAEPFVGLPGMSNGVPLDPSFLAVLLGAGGARTVSAAPESATASNVRESPSDKETQPVSGIVPRAQESVASADAGLAFALRLSREAPAAPEGDASSETVGAGASMHSFANELEAAASKAVTEMKTRAGDENAANASPAASNILQNSVAAPAGNEPTQSAPAASSAAKVDAPELPSPLSTPVRAVRVELGSDSNQRVALTLVERGGALSVSVRSADSNLARSLQEHLPDLSARLIEQRYQTEVWAPRVELPSASAESAEAGNQNFESGGQRQGGQDGNSNSGQQQERREREAPAWFEELAAIGKTPQIRSEYLWVQ